MARKASESRRKKREEKKRARRREKAKERQKRKRPPPGELPIKETLLNHDWEDTRYAKVFVSRIHHEGGLLVAHFMIDLDGFGLVSVAGPGRYTQEYVDGVIDRSELKPADPGVCSAFVHEAVKWTNRFHFFLPKKTRKAMAILPEPAECPAEFGRDGEPFLRGEESEVRKHLALSGLRLEDFAGTFVTSADTEKETYFVSREYLKEAKRDDPLVRLERLAAMADSYEKSGQKEKAQELHGTMEKVAEECNRLAGFLHYLRDYYVRQELMEKAIDTCRRIVEVTEEPEAKAMARLDVADFTRYLGDALQADEMYQKVISENPDLAKAKFRYAEFLCKAARREEGKEKYRELISGLKDREEERDLLRRSYRRLYDILMREGNKSEAKALYKEAKKEQKIRL